MPFNWGAAEDAIRQWLMIGSGYPDQRVVHLDDNANRPALDYIGFALAALRPIGQDDLVWTYDAAQPNGSQIKAEVSGERETTCEIQGFSKQRSGDTSSRAVLSRVQTAVGLPTVRAALKAAGVVVFDHGEIGYVPRLLNGEFEGRAILTVRLYCTEDVFERTTWIETVEALDTDTGNVIIIDS